MSLHNMTMLVQTALPAVQETFFTPPRKNDDKEEEDAAEEQSPQSIEVRVKLVDTQVYQWAQMHKTRSCGDLKSQGSRDIATRIVSSLDPFRMRSGIATEALRFQIAGGLDFKVLGIKDYHIVAFSSLQLHSFAYGSWLCRWLHWILGLQH